MGEHLIKKEYFDVKNLSFLLEAEEFKCFGCGETIKKGNPKFSFGENGEEKDLCLYCAILTKKKNEQKIRKNEFNPATLANAHRKNLMKVHLEFATRPADEVLQEIFPEFPKVGLILKEVEK